MNSAVYRFIRFIGRGSDNAVATIIPGFEVAPRGPEGVHV